MGYKIGATIALILILVAVYFLTNPKNQDSTEEEPQDKSPIQRYLYKGDVIEAANTNEDIYDLLLRLSPVDFIVFLDSLPILLNTLLDQREVSVAGHTLKVQDDANLIGDDQGNYWSITQTYVTSFMVFRVDEDNLENVKSDE